MLSYRGSIRYPCARATYCDSKAVLSRDQGLDWPAASVTPAVRVPVLSPTPIFVDVLGIGHYLYAPKSRRRTVFSHHRWRHRHARRVVVVDSWKPTSCRISSDRFHSAGYSTQTANPLVPPGFLEHEPSTYNFSACGSKDTSAIVLPEPTTKKQRHTMWTPPA